ncbi:MAG TPA: tetratricopeptide repeat protein [Kaistiaceae bacterium]|nr:tetratricopeptide repeat protein [Kaistiaceae bacterium]
MRTYEFLIGAVLATALVVAGPARAFDGSTATSDDVGEPDALRIGARAYFSGDKVGALEALRVAAEQGHAAAQWKLGRMYAEGDGVPENDQKAFEYFSQVANAHADDNPANPESRYTASAFVALGTYYLHGIRDSAVKPNIDRARQMYSYAASYFGDPEAQFNLARLYLEDATSESDRLQAARWLKLAAQKGHVRAQALLGELLYSGDDLPLHRPEIGLMWLTIARARAEDVDRDWVAAKQEEAFASASEDERRTAVDLANTWLDK